LRFKSFLSTFAAVNRIMKETILKKATEMFLSLGFKSVTMDDIAAELGISKKTIYQHYANKTDLVEASTMYLFDTISEGIDSIRGQEKNSIEEIFTIRSFMMQHLNNESASPFYQLQKFFPKIFSCLRAKQFEKMNNCMKENLQKGVTLGVYRPDINIEFTSRIYFTGLTGVKDSDVFPTELFDINDVTRQFLEYHLRAIVTEKGLDILQKEINKC
jgi:AcrR family transcriptional regulator